MPRIVRQLTERGEAPLEVEYIAEDVPDPSPIESKPPEQAKADDKVEPAKDKKKRKPEEKQPEPPEVAMVEPPKPAVPPPPPPPPPPPQPPPPMVPLQHMKMVDQDRPDDEPDNKDAKYLAQKNHRTTEDTRTLDTNLVHEVKGPQTATSTPNENQDKNVGEKERKVAELEEQKGDPHEIVRGQPSPGQQGKAKPTVDNKPAKLAMRNLTPQNVEQQKLEDKAREGAELPDAELGPGGVPLARVGNAGERAQAAQKGVKPKFDFNLKPNQYDQIVGFATAEKERRAAARGERSHVQGHWDRLQAKLALARSSLENFTPEVKVGAQAELGTRAHPFAAYIAQMHRQIHKLWAFGFLADIESRATGDYADLTLWTQLEIVLNGDGTLAKVTIVRSSGNSSFDLAALDTVSSSAPYPTPPAAIKSANGKVYLDWRFHRDDRQCGTFGVDPHIVTTVGDNQDHDTSEVAKGQENGAPGLPRMTPPRTLRRSAVPVGAPVEKREGEGPTSEGGEEGSPAGRSSTPTRPKPAVEVTDAGTAVPDDAKSAAESWFAAYTRGDARWLAGWSAAPFLADGSIVAKDPTAVKAMLAELLKDGTGRKVGPVEVMTAAGIRVRRGGLPPGGESDGSMVFAIGRLAGEEVTLLLKKSDHGWRVCGLAR